MEFQQKVVPGSVSMAITGIYLYQLYQKTQIEYLSYKKGKKRFRDMPSFLKGYFDRGLEYQRYWVWIRGFSLDNNIEMSELEFDLSGKIQW
jgi:hypothetical protein